MSRTFGLNRTRDWVDALRRDIQALRADDLNPVLARHCAYTAWALCDWALSEVCPSAGRTELTNFKEAVKRTCPAIGYMQDICTEAKHAKISYHIPSIKTAELETGDYSPKDFSRDFDVSRLQIVTADGNVIWFTDAAEEVLEFWEAFCDRHGI